MGLRVVEGFTVDLHASCGFGKSFSVTAYFSTNEKGDLLQLSFTMATGSAKDDGRSEQLIKEVRNFPRPRIMPLLLADGSKLWCVRRRRS